MVPRSPPQPRPEVGHVTFGMRNRIERWLGTLKARTKRFYNNFPNNSTIKSVKTYIETFIETFATMAQHTTQKQKLDNIHALIATIIWVISLQKRYFYSKHQISQFPNSRINALLEEISSYHADGSDTENLKSYQNVSNFLFLPC